MKIKNIILITSILSLLIVLLVGFWVYTIYEDYENVKQNENIAKNINSTIFKINILSGEYLLYYQERTVQQWKKSHARLDKFIKSSNTEVMNETIGISSIQKNHDRSLILFKRLEHVRNEMSKLNSNKTLLIKQEKALSEQLLSLSQFMSFKSEELTTIVDRNKQEVEEELYLLALVIFILFIFILVASWSFILFRIVLPVNKYKKYIVNVDIERLNEKHYVSRQDEVGELIDSFNRMSKKLFNTTVSRDKLVVEVTERKKSEEKLKNEQDLNSTVLEGISNVVIILNSENKCVKFNQHAEQSTGYSRKNILNKDVWNLLLPDNEQQKINELFNRLKSEITSISGYRENHLIIKNGEHRLFEWRDDLIRDSANNVTHIISIGKDITEKRNADIENERLQRELNQSRKMEALGKLTGGIAHDFNNMLAIIIGYTELSLKKVDELNLESSCNNYLTQIKIASGRAKELVIKMLAFSRTDQSSSSSIQLSPLLDENLLLLKSIIPSTINVKSNNNNNLPDIWMDPVQFQQILMNLIINAKDAMDGEGNLDISLSVNNLHGKECSSCHQTIMGLWVELVVADNGSGMEKEVVDKVFDPFFTTKDMAHGTGMGLSVVHGIVKGHGGHIIVESKKGEGTSFTLLFPPLLTKKDSLLDESKNAEDLTVNTDYHILIVDDEESVANMQSELLTMSGYKCTTLYNSQQALDLYLSEADSYDLILTDQTMPNLTGLELISRIRKEKHNIPIIIVTGFSDKLSSNKVIYENVILLKKPVDVKLLQHTVAKMLKSDSNL